MTKEDAAIEPMRELRVDPAEWDGAVAAVAGPQIVVGGPGTGKTEFLVRRAEHLVTREQVAPDEILVLSFGRRGVADVADRIRNRLAETAAPIPALTFHALAADIVEAHAVSHGWITPPQILTGPEQSALVRELLTGEDPATWSVAFRGLLASATFAEEVTDFLLRASEQLLTPADVAAMARERDDWKGLAAFMERYRDELERRSRIDYGVLLSEANAIVESGHADLSRYAFVLVDEYQDTTVAQARLLAALSAPHRNLTAAADPYQSIYSFRGAALQNVARFPEQFRTASGEAAQRIVLTTSFRTPASILAAAERVTAHDLPGSAGRVTPAKGAGRVDVHVFEQHTAEAEWIAREVTRLHLEERVPYGRMAVFVRSKRRFLPELSRSLQRRGVPHDPPNSRLAEQPAVRFVLDLVTATVSDEPAERLRALRRILLGPWFALPLGRLRDLERHTQRSGATLPAVLRADVPELADLAGLLGDRTWAETVPAAEGTWRVWSSLPQLAAVVTDDDRRAERAAWASLSQVLSRWNERNPDATLTDYQRLLVEEEFEAQPLLSYAAPETDWLTVTTLHQAKGLEFDVVFIADAVEGVFPDLRARDSLLGVRHLLPDVPREPGAYHRFRLQEERRLAYTAMTRAARRVVWTATSAGFEEGRGIPSRFLALVAGTATVADAATPPPGDRPPVTPAEAEALLRRIVGDPAERRPRRLAALDLLASGPRFGLRDPWSFNGLRRAGEDRGLVGPELRLSPSQADAYLQCPRRYALQRRLGIADQPGPHASVGKLVHAVLEAAEQRALARGEPRSHAADAAEILDEVFDPDDFGGGPVAEAWRRRAALVIALLYEKWPADGHVIDVERRLEMEIGGAAWLGFADRIEKRGTDLAIVDYKTSGTAIPLAEASGSLQLGFYLLAARADRELTRHGTPRAAEFWYPYASRKTKRLTTRKFDPAQLDAVESLLAAAAEGIRAEDWTPQPSQACDRCPVRSVCPAQPEGTEGFLA